MTMLTNWAARRVLQNLHDVNADDLAALKLALVRFNARKGAWGAKRAPRRGIPKLTEQQ